MPQSHQMQFSIQENYSLILSSVLILDLNKNIDTYSKEMKKIQVKIIFK